MKTISLHPLSLAVGGAIVVALTLTLGAAQVTQLPPVKSAAPTAAVGFFSAHPRDMVWIAERDPTYVVPVGKILVLTSVGCRTAGSTGSSVYLFVDWVPGASVGVAHFRVERVHPAYQFATGRPFAEGTTINMSSSASTPTNGTGSSYATGYLADA